jgi:hypothetical protein
MKIDGKCHCGKISYEAEIDPEKVYICHCTDCQIITGSAYRWAVPVAEEAFKLLAGEPKTYIKTSDSGATSHQLFCSECASPLYSTAIGDGPAFFNVRVGTARQRAELSPKTQYWCRSALAWAEEIVSAKKFDTQ